LSDNSSQSILLSPKFSYSSSVNPFSYSILSFNRSIAFGLAEIYNNSCCKTPKLDDLIAKILYLSPEKRKEYQLQCKEILPILPPIFQQIVSSVFCEKLDPNYPVEQIRANISQIYQTACNGSWLVPPDGTTIEQSCDLTFSPVVMDDPLTQLIEILQEIFINAPYLYANHKTRIKLTNPTNGSQGWGFWNTLTDPSEQVYAWFIVLDGLNPDGTPYSVNINGQIIPLSGLWVHVFTKGFDKFVGKKIMDIKDIDNNWHDYEINWAKDSITFLVDSKVVQNITNPTIIPSTKMSSHIWVDNAVYSTDPTKFEHWCMTLDKPKIQEIEYVEIALN
jgi:hypothetical protein